MAQFWSMPLTPEGRTTLLRFALAIIPGVTGDDQETFVWIRVQCWGGVERIELEQQEWIMVQHHVECWGVNSGAVIDMKESNRFAIAVDKMLARPCSREEEYAEPVAEIVAPAVVTVVQKKLWD